ncbi:MAG: TonB-dependent receptor, partial [Blastocatellia bacterium]
MNYSRSIIAMAVCLLTLSVCAQAQTITATLEGRVTDNSSAAVNGASVTAVNSSTGLSRSAVTSDSGEYRISLLPVGEYTVTVEHRGFRRDARKIVLVIGQTASLDFDLQAGGVAEQVNVEAADTIAEPTRTEVSSVISQRQIVSLPVNGRQFIDFVLLAPGVTIGDTTSGSTDVIVEPVTKISFAGQNIHFNFVAIDGADNISTASGIQKTTPSQDAVQEFRVVNTVYSAEFGRAVGGIINIITKSGTNEVHGSLYEYFRNDALDAKSILASPGLNTLRQNQFGAAVGGPWRKDRTFYFVNYEGQRRSESPFYNSIVLANIDAINQAKVTRYGLPAENLNLLRDSDADNFLVKLDHNLSERHTLTGRYFFNDARYTNVSPLNDGFDLPSGFKDNFLRDQSIVANLISTFTPNLFNELRAQYAHRSFDFPTVSTQPHLEVANTFAIGVNRGNPDFYKESRFELVDNVTFTRGRHT